MMTYGKHLLSFTFSYLFIISYAFSQSANVQSAANWLKDKNLAKAKEFIDLAAENKSTADDPKMWHYRGNIYYNIHLDTTELNQSEPDAIEKAAVSFINCSKTDKGKYYTDDTNDKVWRAGIGLNNKGNEAFRKGEFERANRLFNLIFDILPLDTDNNLKRNNITPETINRSLYLVAYKAGELEKAKTYLQKLLDVKYNDPLIYVYMSNIYLRQKDTAKALSYIEQGRNLFEDNQTLVSEQIRLYSAQGKTDVLIDKLTAAIESVPDNEQLYYTRGILYGKKNDSQKAIEDYKKALELNPDNADVNYNLGGIYFNQGVAIAAELNNIKPNEQKKYDETKARFESKMKEAQPYFEKALESNPNKTESEGELYQNTLNSLKHLYARTSQTDKYNKIVELIEEQKK